MYLLYTRQSIQHPTPHLFQLIVHIIKILRDQRLVFAYIEYGGINKAFVVNILTQHINTSSEIIVYRESITWNSGSFLNIKIYPLFNKRYLYQNIATLLKIPMKM